MFCHTEVVFESQHIPFLQDYVKETKSGEWKEM